MNLIVRILLPVVLVSSSVLAQQETRRDSSVARMSTFDARSFYSSRMFSLPPSLNVSPISFPGFLRQSLASPLSSVSWKLQEKLGIESAWKNELLEQEKTKTLRTILGSISMGGAAYLAYKHIKKYGLK